MFKFKRGIIPAIMMTKLCNFSYEVAKKLFRAEKISSVIKKDIMNFKEFEMKRGYNFENKEDRVT